LCCFCGDGGGGGGGGSGGGYSQWWIITIIIVVSLTNTVSKIVAIIIINVAVIHWKTNSNVSRERNSKKMKQFIPKSSVNNHIF
jgi:hypothetical protein